MVQITKLHTLTGHKEAIYTLERGIKSNDFYSSGADGFVVKWDLDNPESGHSVAKMAASVYALKLYEEKKVLVVGQNFDGIHFLDIENNEALGSIKCTDAAIFDIQIYKEKVYAGTGDGTIIVLDFESRTVLNKLRFSEKSVRSITILESLGVLIAAYSDHSFRIINLIDHTLEDEILGHTNSIFSIEPALDQEYLVTAGRDARLKFWKVSENFLLDEEIVAHMYAINHIAFRQDGKYFATGSMDKTIKIWDYQKRKLLKVIDKARHNGHLSSINKLLWSGHKNMLISCSDDRSIGVWNIDFDK